MTHLAPELKAKIQKLWDMFWSGGIANPLTAIEQMSYLIFMKRLEDMDIKATQRAFARGEQYTSVFDGAITIRGEKHDKKVCRWSEWKHMRAEDMLIHTRDVVFPFIKQLHNGENTFFAEHMKDAVFLIPKASLLQGAVSVIDDLNISHQNVDTQGDIYEYLLSELKTAGKNGQFRTPRHIIRMMVEMVNPDINDTICDPACGTAGFLVNAYEHIVKRYTSPDKIEYDEMGEPHNLIGDRITELSHWKKLWTRTLYGYDFDTTMVRISLMNAILHGIRQPHINYMDSLSKRFSEHEKYTVVLANPPFKGSIDKNDINDNLTLGTTKTELLFAEQIIRLLIVGGRGGVIVPDGVLFGSSRAHKKLREMLLETCQLEAVVNMPTGVFRPYAGVSTAVLIFTKGGQTDKVWFYDMESDGYSLDDKRTFIDGKGDIPNIIERFRKRFEENPEDRKGKCFFVPAEEIKENNYDLSISKYKEIVYEEVVYDNPKDIIDWVMKKEEEIAKELSELKKMIK